ASEPSRPRYTSGLPFEPLVNPIRSLPLEALPDLPPVVPPPVAPPPVAEVEFDRSRLLPFSLVVVVFVLPVPSVEFDRSCLFPFPFAEPVFVLPVPSVAVDLSCLFPLPVDVVVSAPAPPLVRAPVPSVVRIFPAFPVFCDESPVAPAPVLLLVVLEVLVSRPACLLPPLTLVPPLLLVLLPVSRDRPV